MTERKDYKGKTVRIKEDVQHFQLPDFGGSEILIEDYWDTMTGKSWMFTKGNPACLVYAIRTGSSGITTPDDLVLYGKIYGLGHLVHVSEIEETEEDG